MGEPGSATLRVRGAIAVAALLCTLVMTACGTFEMGVERAPVPSLPAAIGTPAPTASLPPTQPPAAAVPTASPAPTQPPATAGPTPTSAAVPTDTVTIYLIALEDNSGMGKTIGCGDSLVAVQRTVAPTAEPLVAALRELLSIREQFLGQSGLYNSLYMADLQVDRALIEDGKASVYLYGTYRLGGTCDEPRFVAQIEETVLASPGVSEAAVFINDSPLRPSGGQGS